MSSIVCAETKAICLLFATLFVFGANDDEVFTTTPKDTEVFVGEDVQFDWEYAAKDVREVRFGVQDPETKELKVVAIYVKKKDGTVIFNNQFESIKWIRDRVEVVPGRRASFKINKVEMRDSGTFFCILMIGEENKAEPNGVELKVVDLLIDKLPSTQSAESWQGRRITLVCAVRVPPGGTNAKFSWMHVPSNRTVARKFHDDTRSKSYLTITTYKDEDFEALQCRAETKDTVKFHTINITKLSSPTEPRNLKVERAFNKDEDGRPFIRLRWDPPRENGGAGIDNYIISYIPKGLSWTSSTTAQTKETAFDDLKLPSGNIYQARVRARNKAGTGPPSNEVEINLEDNPHDSRLSDSTAVQCSSHLEMSLLLLSLVVWLL